MTKFLAVLLLFSLNAQAAPTLSKAQETALIAEINEIANNAGVANGGTDILPYKGEFNLEEALQSIAEERPDVYGRDDEGNENFSDLKHRMKTVVGITKAIRFMKTQDFQDSTGEDGIGLKIAALKERGLVREILHRTTDEIIRQTWLIPEVFDVYIEYTVNGVAKGQLLRLHYELGD